MSFANHDFMALDQPDIVDAIGIERTSGLAVLTIADEWGWENEGQHLLALQAKLNAYFRFVESGQIAKAYPDAARRQAVIDVVGRYPLPQAGLELLKRASDACAELGIQIRNTYHPGASG